MKKLQIYKRLGNYFNISRLCYRVCCKCVVLSSLLQMRTRQATKSKLGINCGKSYFRISYIQYESWSSSTATNEQRRVVIANWAGRSVISVCEKSCLRNLAKIKERVTKYNKRIGDSFVCHKTWQSNL